MSSPERWISLLRCGHEVRFRGEPRPGGWVGCITRPCQGQQQVVSVSAVREVPAPGEIGRQGELFTVTGEAA